MARSDVRSNSILNIFSWTKQQWLMILVIIAVTAFIRFYKLAQVPEGITWDEAAIGYDGWAVWNYRRDEWLNFLPISFQSFGDYKAPLAIYITGVLTSLLGRDPWVIRLPFALSGVAGVLGMMLLIQALLLPKPKSALSYVPLAIGVLLALNPWHVHFSRIGIESIIALFFVIWGTLGLVLSYRLVRLNKKMLFGLYGVTAIFFAASIYTYHSTKIVVPLLLFTAFAYKLIRKKNFWPSLFIGAGTVILLLPMLYDMAFGNGGARFSQTTVFNEETPFVQSLGLFAQHYLEHFTPNFLVQGGTTTLRHSDGKWGIFYFTELLMIIGALGFAVNSWKTNKTVSRLTLIGVVWVMICLIPAGIGKESPHPSRSLQALPGYYMIIAAFLTQFAQLDFSKVKKQLLYASVGVFSLIHVVLFALYQQHYYNEFAVDSSEDLLAGYIEAVKVAIEHQNTREIIFTNQYGQPHMFFLLVKGISPMEYQYGALNRFKIVDNVMPTDIDVPNRLVVATPEELDPSQATSLITSANGEVRFVIVDTVLLCERFNRACPAEFER